MLGAILAFQVHIRGGLPHVGDCHATQRDGKLPGESNEQRITATPQVDVTRGWSFARPGLEPENVPMTIGCAWLLEDAPRIADRVRGTSAGCGLDEFRAYMLLSQAGRIRL